MKVLVVRRSHHRIWTHFLSVLFHSKEKRRDTAVHRDAILLKQVIKVGGLGGTFPSFRRQVEHAAAFLNELTDGIKLGQRKLVSRMEEKGNRVVFEEVIRDQSLRMARDGLSLSWS